MVTLRINDMTCGHWASTIARAVAGVDKNARVEVDIPQRLFSIRSTATDIELMEAIQDSGYTPVKLASAPPNSLPSGSGCRCGSRPRAASPVDMAQAAAPPTNSCCG